MSGGQITAIIIVAIVMIASIFRARYRHERGDRQVERAARKDGETRRLREEVKMLKDRLAVIERITVEKENSLEREIESLRDR